MGPRKTQSKRNKCEKRVQKGQWGGGLVGVVGVVVGGSGGGQWWGELVVVVGQWGQWWGVVMVGGGRGGVGVGIVGGLVGGQCWGYIERFHLQSMPLPMATTVLQDSLWLPMSCICDPITCYHRSCVFLCQITFPYLCKHHILITWAHIKIPSQEGRSFIFLLTCAILAIIHLII